MDCNLVNLLVLGPAVVVTLVPEPLQLAAATLPTYWPVNSVVAGVAGDPFWALFLLGGLVVHLLGLLFSVGGSPAEPTNREAPTG